MRLFFSSRVSSLLLLLHVCIYADDARRAVKTKSPWEKIERGLLQIEGGKERGEWLASSGRRTGKERKEPFDIDEE